MEPFSGNTMIFQSTLPVWGATDGTLQDICTRGISIHAPRVGSDFPVCPRKSRRGYFNPRSPCGERHQPPGNGRLCHSISIHAPRVGSDVNVPKRSQASDISIHAPRVGSDGHYRPRPDQGGISIHAPRVGSDPVQYPNISPHSISIHAPRVGSDWRYSQLPSVRRYFNPRSPCGERLSSKVTKTYAKDFNPRSPCGERRQNPGETYLRHRISIHAPRVGSDRPGDTHFST